MTELNFWKAFEDRMKEIESCKRYVWNNIWQKLGADAKWNATDFSELEGDKWVMIKKLDAAKLTDLLPKGSVDYVHTDPPYADQVPYFEISVPWIAWLELESENEWRKEMEDEIILSDSPKRPEKHRKSEQGLKDYRARFFKSFSQIRDVLKRDRWISVWYCCSNEDYWRALTDNLNKLGFERVKSHVIVRAVTTFKQVITKAQDPLAKVREEEILRHYKYVGWEVPIFPVPLDEAVKMFLETAVSEIQRKGEASTGEITVAFFSNCLDTYDNPPPDYDYIELLKKNGRFEVAKTTIKVGRKEIEEERWRLKGHGQKALSEWLKYG